MSEHAISEREKRLTLLGLMLVFLLGALDSTIVGTAMPRIIQELHGFELYSWVTTSYLLCSTVVVPIYGKLSDLYGRKCILLFGICIFLVGSALCGLSGEFGALPLLGSGMSQLVVFRAIQGLGSAALFSLSFTIIADLFTPRERGKFMGLFGATFGLASAIGPLVGGFFTDHGTVRVAGWEIAGWRWVFYVNLPLGLCSILLISLKMPPLHPHGRRGSIDYPGAILFIAATIPLLLVLTWGGQSYAWTSPQILALMITGVLALGSFIVVQTRARDPLLPLSLFRNRVFATSNLAGFCIGMSFLGVIMFMPLFIQIVLGLNATQNGWTQMPMTLGLLVGSIAAGRLATRTGQYKPLIVGGTVILLGALLWLAAISTRTLPVDLSIRLFAVGIGLGPSQSLFNLAVQNAVPITQLGIATSASQFFRQMGSVVGLALFGAVLTHVLTAELSKRVPELSTMTARIDLSQVQSQALDPHRMQRQIAARADAQYRQIAGTYEGDPGARQHILADASIPQAIKDLVREDSSPSEAAPRVLAALKSALAARAAALSARLETGMKESFAASITYLIRLGFWLIAASLVLTFLIPAIPLRDTSPAQERARAAEEIRASRRSSTP
ncbi:MAG TPA: MDR family MFS transporter [Steroidobacteraceae bacterium]|nr:MDR family MFS transporter [Steroidobacteraceae bacterium]